MIVILLIIIAACLLFGATKTKAALGSLLTLAFIGFFILLIVVSCTSMFT